MKIFDFILKHINPEKYARKIGVRIGKNCRIGIENWGTEPYLITIGDHVLLSSEITFLNHDGATWVFRDTEKYKGVNKFGTIEIGDNCFIGWGVTILPNVKIGSNCVVGAGSLVTKSIPDGEIWGGVPAHKITTVEEYAEKCKNSPNCVKFEPAEGRAKGQKGKRATLEKYFYGEEHK